MLTSILDLECDTTLTMPRLNTAISYFISVVRVLMISLVMSPLMVCIFCLIFTLVTLIQINGPLAKVSIFPNRATAQWWNMMWWVRSDTEILAQDHKITKSQIVRSENHKITKYEPASHLARKATNRALIVARIAIYLTVYYSRDPIWEIWFGHFVSWVVFHV